MNEAAFVNRREPDWKKLTTLCDRADSSLTALGTEELEEFVRLYRRVSSDLALVRTRSSNAALIQFLNDLTARAYSQLYAAPAKPIKKSIVDSVKLLARVVRRRRAFVFVSIALTLIPMFFTMAVLSARPDLKPLIISRDEQQLFDAWKSGRHDEATAESASLMWGFYASNNPKVSLIMGAVGAATFGLGTLAMLVMNGNVIGALTSEMASVGKVDFLYVSILPHGVPEFTGMFLAGATGLLLGWATINPGQRRRGDALREAGKDAIVLLSGSVALMLIAAPIEGFFSFNPSIPSELKLVVIVIELLAWGAFWTTYGVEEERAEASLRAEPKASS